MTDYRFEYIKNQMIDELLVEQQKSKILMEQQKSNDEKIRQLKEDIAINKEKLQKLEELQRTKSPVEEAFKKVFSHYPNEKDFREGIWFGFEKGYNASQSKNTEPYCPDEPLEYDEVEWDEKDNPKPETLLDVIRNLGYSYDMCYEIVDAVEKFKKSKEKEMIKRNLKTSLQELANGDVRPIYDVVRESLKWCEEHPDESVEDYLTPQGPQGPVGPGPGPKGVIVGYEPTPQESEDDEWTLDKLQEKNWYVDAKTNLKSNWEPKPKTPEKTEKSLREAFVKAQQTEEWKETQRKIDAPLEERSDFDKMLDDLVEKFKKDPPDFLKFELSRSLEDRIYKWWETCFVHHPEWSMEECVEDLLDIITLFLPGEQDSSGTQRIETIVAVEAHNELLQKIKSKLRNKKDT